MQIGRLIWIRLGVLCMKRLRCSSQITHGKHLAWDSDDFSWADNFDFTPFKYILCIIMNVFLSIWIYVIKFAQWFSSQIQVVNCLDNFLLPGRTGAPVSNKSLAKSMPWLTLHVSHKPQWGTDSTTFLVSILRLSSAADNSFWLFGLNSKWTSSTYSFPLLWRIVFPSTQT